MRRKIYAIALCAIGMGISVLSCNQGEAMEPVKTRAESKLEAGRLDGSGMKVSNGWLRFDNRESFNKVMQELHEYEARDLGKWESPYRDQGYQSLRAFYEQTDADQSEDRRALTVDSLIATNQILECPDSWFATALSRDGYIQIADTVYSFKPGQKNGEAYAVPDRHVKSLIKGQSPQGLDGVKVHYTSFRAIPFPRWGETGDVTKGSRLRLPICLYPSGFMPNWWGQSGDDIYAGDDNTMFPEHNGRQVKLNYHRWRVGYIFYASAGIRCKMWKHTRFAGWQSVTYAEEMIMESCVKGNVFIPGLPLLPFNEQTSPQWPYFSRQTENNFEKTMKWTGSGIFNEIILDHFNFHFKVNYRGRIVERNIRQ